MTGYEVDEDGRLLNPLIDLSDRAPEDFAAATRRVLDRAGEDFVTSLCVYVDRGKASCLIGQVLHEMGAPIEDIAMLEAPSIISTAILSLIEYRVVLVPSSVVHPLGAAQEAQDQGIRWGDAAAPLLALGG
jgi:hypothetical protein